ncbi:hypothetical protein CSB45_00930 [candidate division KSB3 bacterium]|uniref:Bro-N domain-containing protein n=1 Tax=candidate division KSB3 bacterium TaxID=2044937 RepID=A0A2G6EC16_9BACT|nr:MAG: hypothetical protein CSB45_00930 [candidate division KSB3 bacterium]
MSNSTSSSPQGLELLANSISLTPVEVKGQKLFSSEELGKALGFQYPRQSITKIYERNRKELKHYSIEVKLTSVDGSLRNTRAFTREGALIVSMLARTNRAKAVRAWLARLGDTVIAEAERKGYLEARRENAAELLAARPLWQKIARYKGMGLYNAEIGRLTGLSKETVRKHLRRMENCGIIEPPANLHQLQQRVQRLLPGMEVE